MTDWLSPAAAGALLGVGPDRVAQLARDGSLHARRTPGGHLRVDRADVERLAIRASQAADTPAPEEPPDDALPELEEDATRPARRTSWEALPPWKQRVREAQADVEVLGLDDEKDRILQAREERKSAQKRAQDEREAQAAEEARVRGLRTQAGWYVGFALPAEARADVMREIERVVSSARYPRRVDSINASIMLKADVDRCLAPFRAREAEEAKAAREPKLRELAILTAELMAMRQIPADWDNRTRAAFERECRRAVTKEYRPGIDQRELNDLAQDVFDQWLDEEEGDLNDDELDDDEFADDDDEYEDDDDGDDW